MKHSPSILLFLVAVAAGVPHYNEERGFNTDSPENSDPKTPPTSIKALTLPTSNPFSGGFTTAPDSCGNFIDPSEDCLRELYTQEEGVVAFGGGNLKFEKGHGCDEETQQAQIQTAAYNALTLVTVANVKPTTAKWISTWLAYIGPDYAEKENRILDNIKRVGDFAAEKKFDIVMSCTDTKNLCGESQEGKRVGGYTWNQAGYFGTEFYHITFCPIFFSLNNLEQTHKLIEEGLSGGDTSYAQSADWQKNQGQYFLHEMMHLNSVGKPHITDEYVDPKAKGQNSKRAYGPKLVYKLAQGLLNEGGGATRASTNADSYAWLTNSLFWYDCTGYFPRPPSYKGVTVTVAEEVRSQDVFSLDLGDFSENPSDAEVQSRVIEIMASMATDLDVLPGPSCSSDGDSFSREDGLKAIEKFCSDRDIWDIVIAPPISMGKPKTDDGRLKAFEVYDTYDIAGSDSKIWVDVSFATEDCTGSFSVATGSTDFEKKTNCIKNFDAILDGCDRSGTLKNGTMQNVCSVYRLSAATENPSKDLFSFVGSFQCEDTDVSALGSHYDGPLKGTCTCWYSEYPGLVDIFTKDEGKECTGTDVSQSAVLSN